MAGRRKSGGTPPALPTSKKPFPGAAAPLRKGGGRKPSKSGSK